jgi:hypothetical protein
LAAAALLAGVGLVSSACANFPPTVYTVPPPRGEDPIREEDPPPVDQPDPPVRQTPEPGTLALVAVGAATLGAAWRKRKANAVA